MKARLTAALERTLTGPAIRQLLVWGLLAQLMLLGAVVIAEIGAGGRFLAAWFGVLIDRVTERPVQPALYVALALPTLVGWRAGVVLVKQDGRWMEGALLFVAVLSPWLVPMVKIALGMEGGLMFAAAPGAFAAGLLLALSLRLWRGKSEAVPQWSGDLLREHWPRIVMLAWAMAFVLGVGLLAADAASDLAWRRGAVRVRAFIATYDCRTPESRDAVRRLRTYGPSGVTGRLPTCRTDTPRGRLCDPYRTPEEMQEGLRGLVEEGGLLDALASTCSVEGWALAGPVLEAQFDSRCGSDACLPQLLAQSRLYKEAHAARIAAAHPEAVADALIAKIPMPGRPGGEARVVLAVEPATRRTLPQLSRLMRNQTDLTAGGLLLLIRELSPLGVRILGAVRARGDEEPAAIATLVLTIRGELTPTEGELREALARTRCDLALAIVGLLPAELVPTGATDRCR